MTINGMTRRTSLLALTLGSGALAAGVSSKPAMADCHDSTLPGLCGTDVESLRELHREQINRIEGLLEPHRITALSRPGLEAALDYLRAINANFISQEETNNIKQWIQILFDDIGTGIDYIYDRISNLAHEVIGTFGDVARAISAIFLDAIDKSRDIASRLSDDQVVKVVAHDLRGALDGLDIATHIIRRYRLPVHPAALMFSAFVGGASGSVIGYFDYAHTEANS